MDAPQLALPPTDAGMEERWSAVLHLSETVPMAPPPRRTTTSSRGLAEAVLIAGAAVFFTHLLQAPTGGAFYFVPLAAVTLLAMTRGTSPAVLAAILATVGLWYFLTEPYWSFGLASSTEALRLVSFGASAILISLVGGAQHQARLRLMRQLNLNQSIAQNAAEAIFVTDEHGRVTFTNAEAVKLFGFNEAELAGQVLHDAIHHHRPDGRLLPMAECPMASVSQS
ncbi:MAG: DUF4118 domain-containing protein, partial [Deltaproteobacteria bacterium]|nr:DUF4118 domain-containing protein [Deltaproteobacteria bacterium]